MSKVQPGHKVRIGAEILTAQECEMLLILAARDFMVAVVQGGGADEREEMTSMLAFIGEHDREWQLDMTAVIVEAVGRWGHMEGLHWVHDRIECETTKAALAAVFASIQQDCYRSVIGFIAEMN